ncbi:ATP-NAD kinase family protein [Streptomyces sp. NRRL WC-3742]|uniref:ATP-NAD kinase family protein n=1 Tax=Streptomyces sp. NRRL WC-3742 TaxID=1463934 RepID=UPI0004C4B3FA|nr:NAD(+)/NADH kinase [Streptomyces sp. NRRL WC-3742]
MTPRPRVGLVVNPVAGLGGRVGLKGSDGAEAQRRARELGARPSAPHRAELMVRQLLVLVPEVELLTVGGPMGVEGVGRVVHRPHGEPTSAADTRAAVRVLVEAGAQLLLFCGGDGTARDVLDAVGPASAVPVLGIPAGVKMHSAVFAVHPRAAAEVAAAWARGAGVRLATAEVVDRDEEALRAGRVGARLYGHLTVPVLPSRVQQRKTGSSTADPASLAGIAGIAAEIADRVGPGALLVLGPGTTTHAVAAALGVPDASLTGVDVLRVNGDGTARLDLRDARADQLLALPHTPWIALSPVGGQGFLLGRGNQQLSPELLRAAGPERLLVLATEAKLAALAGRPLLLDTGDPALDRALSGHTRVITGRHASAVYRLTD